MLTSYFHHLEEHSAVRWWGRVTKAVGQLVESEGPFRSVGECCAIADRSGRIYEGEVVGFRGATVLSMPLERLGGIRYGDRIATWGERPRYASGRTFGGA